jgi:uncharacterized membrane protein
VERVFLNNPSRRGMAAIESALVLPLVLLLTLGLCEYGWLFLKQQQISQAAHAGARAGAIADGTAATVTATVQARMTDAGIPQGAYTVTLIPADPTQLVRGEPFAVEISVPYAGIAIVRATLIPTPASLRGRSTLAREGS